MRQDPCSTRPVSPFGDILAQRRADEAARHFAQPDVETVIDCLTAAMFGEVMKSLRSALSLH
jgi:hypothetical protein